MFFRKSGFRPRSDMKSNWIFAVILGTVTGYTVFKESFEAERAKASAALPKSNDPPSPSSSSPVKANYISTIGSALIYSTGGMPTYYTNTTHYITLGNNKFELHHPAVETSYRIIISHTRITPL
eukprot:scaffold2678_cov236-Ochromonas_danica.AAC.4